jgi:hypothetical protein
MEGKMMSVKEVKAAILKEIEAERKLAAPELVDEPFIKAEEAFNQLAEFDVTKESIGTTVGAMRDFLNHLFEILTKETLDTLKRTEEENKETEKKKAEWQALPDLLRKEGEEEEFVFKDPVEIMEKDLKLTFERAEEDVTEKLTQFLDDRIHADRNSLVREKKKAKKQLFVARETTEVFRRSYDESARARQAEELRVVDERWTKKFDAEVGEMTDKVEHLEFQRRLLTQTVKTRDEKVHELSELVADQKFQLKEMKTKLDTAKKQKGGGGGGGGGRSYGGVGGIGHSHAASAGGGSHTPSSSGPNHAPWNPNHHAPSQLSTTPSTITRVAEVKQAGDSSKGVVMAEGMDSDPAAAGEVAAADVTTTTGAAAAATATNTSDDEADADASAIPTDAAAISGAVGVEIGTQTESSPLSDNATSIDGKDDEAVVESKEEGAVASAAGPLLADVKQSMKEAKGMLEAAAGKNEAAADGDEGKGVPAAANAKGDDKQQLQEEKMKEAAESKVDSKEENDEDDNSSPFSPVRGLTRQDTANSILTTASSPGQHDHTCPDCSEMRAEIKLLRARVVDMMENHRADSPTPMMTSPMGSVTGRKVSLGSNPGANTEALSTIGAGVTNGSNLESWSAVSPVKVNVHGSAILGAQESIESAGAGAGAGTRNNDQESNNGGNSAQQQQQHGSVSVSQPGRGLIISSTMGGIEGEQGSLDLMSGYGLSQERSHTGGDPDGDGTAGGDNMTVASHESRQSTHETLLADMRVGMVGDNILQSYGSCNDLVGGEGEVGSTQRQISDLQRALMEQLKKDAAMSEKLEWSEKQSLSLGEQLVDANRARKESEKLHSLQMLERGILLKELSQQITDMRSQMQHLQLAHKKAARAHLREMAMLKAGSRVGSAVTMTDSSRVSTAEQRAAKTPVQVPMASVSVDQGFGKEHEHKPIAAVTSGDTAVVVDPTKSSSRMLQASSSMPLLSDEYGNYHTTGKSIKPNPGRLSPVFKLRGRLGESTEFTLNDLDKDSRRTVRNEAASYMESEKMEQLRAVRGQIVGMLSERYPPEKRQEQMLAVEKARTRALKSRETQLADKVVKKKILL